MNGERTRRDSNSVAASQYVIKVNNDEVDESDGSDQTPSFSIIVLTIIRSVSTDRSSLPMMRDLPLHRGIATCEAMP